MELGYAKSLYASLRGEVSVFQQDFHIKTRPFAAFAAFAALYAVVTCLGYGLQYGSDYIAVLWPAAGVLCAVVAISPVRRWPAILVTALLVEAACGMVDLPSEPGVANRTLYVIANFTGLVEALAFAWLLRSNGAVANPLGSAGDLLRFVRICLGVPAVVTLGGVSVSSMFDGSLGDPWLWQQWWFGNTCGILIFAAPVLAWRSGPSREVTRAATLEMVVLLATFAVTAHVLFSAPFSGGDLRHLAPVLILPHLAWALARFGPRTLTITTAMLGVIVIWHMVRGRGPFNIGGSDDRVNVLAAQGYLVPTTLSLFFIAAMMSERRADLLARLETERRLLRLDKIEAVGTMASGLAHDLSSYSLAIRSFLSALRRSLPAENEAAHGALAGLGRSAEGIEALTRALATVAREEHTADNGTGCDLGETVGDRISTLRAVLPGRIELDARLPETPVGVTLSGAAVQRIVTNLVVNARDAIRDTGRVRIEVQTSETHGLLIVSDTGAGMTEEVRQHIFDPFFTTKPRDRGTGLGLAILLGLVEDAGGRVEVSTAPGAGTSFRIALPLRGGTAAEEQ